MEIKSIGFKGVTAKEFIKTFKMTKTIKITVLEQDEYPLNLYINAGNYPYTVADELNQKGCKILVKEYECNLTAEQLYDFIKQNSKRTV